VWAFAMSTSKKSPKHLTPSSQIETLAYKEPWLGTLELKGIAMTPNPMPFRCITIGHHVLPMKLEVVLNKLKIMFSIVKNVKVIFS